jgi:uncharacterized membrane protein
MNKWIQLLAGLVLLLGGIFVFGMNFFGFGSAALTVLKGAAMWIVLLVGLVLVILGISNLKE